MVEKKSVSDLEYEAMQKALNANDERIREAENEGRLPRRPPPKMIFVKPAAHLKRVLTSDLQEITGIVEVSERDLWIRSRIREGDLEVVEQPPPPPDPTTQPTSEQPPPPPAPEQPQ